MVERAAKGLADIVAANTAISNVDAKAGVLSYRGYDIDQLIGRTSFEEVAYLLQRGALPGRAELAAYQAELAAARAELGPAVEAVLPVVARDQPMAALRTLVSVLSADIPAAVSGGAVSGDAVSEAAVAARLVGQFPVLVARLGGPSAPAVRDDLGVAGNLLWQLTGAEPAHADLLDRVLVLLADHTMNASTFAARVCAATQSDLHSAVVAALGTLKGPLHGGANSAVLDLLAEVEAAGGATEVVRSRLDRGERIVGFGHRAYGGADPRAKHLRAMSQQLAERTGDRRYHDLSVALEHAVADAGGPPPNVDLYAASVYHGLGIPPELAAPVLAAARMAGWTAHAMEQHADNRLIRPDALYIGPKRQVWMPIQERI